MGKSTASNGDNTTSDTPAARTGGRTYGGQSQQQRKAQRRQQFLQAGLEVFGTEGFRNATVRGLCRQAQLTDRYFYSEFGNLEGLLQAVYGQCMDSIKQQLFNAFSQAQPGGQIEVLAQQGLAAFFSAMQDARVARVCMLELEGVSAATDRFYHGYMQDFANMVMTLARTVHPHWQLSDDEYALLGMGFIGAMRQVTTYWLQSGCSTSQQTLVSTGMRMIMGLVRQIESEQ
ncbi:TetR/AcrR family transcriptional regulator [Thalassolituus sp. UBA2009]|jgi:AcrR family transcriptional regulator|uniref:TetR/AcrR family transcriptional regulator n=1 Tax=Thalassolituus sp. UBA2009 TaxID=1947658 RepID=UPI000C5CBB66|nr:helix-turn-helix domain-containing protein [Thalassolituus sp. UBA2009]MAY14216.1 TetR family transcriptional regulator [Oceanospirillaceae bacterium]